MERPFQAMMEAPPLALEATHHLSRERSRRRRGQTAERAAWVSEVERHRSDKRKFAAVFTGSAVAERGICVVQPLLADALVVGEQMLGTRAPRNRGAAIPHVISFLSRHNRELL